MFRAGIGIERGFNHRPSGCEPHGINRETVAPRGSHVANRRGLTTQSGHRIEQNGKVSAQLGLVRVKTGCRRFRRMFEQFCKTHGIVWKLPTMPIPISERWVDCETGEYVSEPASPIPQEHTTLFEVTGTDSALNLLCSQPFIVHGGYGADASFVMNVREPHIGATLDIAHRRSTFTQSADGRYQRVVFFGR